MYRRTSDGSVEDENGKVIWFSCERFVRDIGEGNCCFICGAQPGTKAFNNEHVIPRWVLQRYDLFDRVITLPNGASCRYGQYTVPCCAECNSHMGREIEIPISALTAQGLNVVAEEINRGSSLILFVWLGPIFLKTHLMDRHLRFHLDRRKPDGQIADIYGWDTLHHIHSVVRSFYNGCAISKYVIGSMIVLPVRKELSTEDFDYGDLYASQTIHVRLGDIAFLAVFNDSCGALNLLMPTIERITGAVSEIQLRELMAELAFLNLSLKERPRYRSEFDLGDGIYRITADVPHELELTDIDMSLRGKLMYNALRQVLGSVVAPDIEHEQLLGEVKAGKRTFLFSPDGTFNAPPAVRVPETKIRKPV